MAREARKTSAQYKRDQRMRLKKQRICTTCCRNKAKRGYVTCQGCLDVRAERKPELVSAS